MLEQALQDALKAALKNEEKVRVSALRLLISDIKNKKIADRVKEELDDEEVILLIQKRIRMHKESIEQFGKAGRKDLVDTETNQMKVLEIYLPEQMTKSELEIIVLEAIKQVGATSFKEMGSVMNNVMARVKGKAEGKVVSEIVKTKLAK